MLIPLVEMRAFVSFAVGFKIQSPNSGLTSCNKPLSQSTMIGTGNI
jgi:hypothetical protein